MKPSLGRAIIGGFVGTPAMTVLMYMAAPLLGVRVDVAEMLGSMLGGWTLGIIVHIVNGSLIFPVAYVYLFTYLPPAPPVARGLMYGGGLWLMSQVVVMPLMGAGLFNAHLGGVMSSIAFFLGHIVYGALVGSLAGAVPLNQAKLKELTEQGR
jgi:uncharacterized membrane protein YagU involved in acid resistance